MDAPIEILEPLITADQIRSRVAELAQQINADYAGTERPLSVIVVLKGACFFAIDLLRLLSLPTRIDFVKASSYVGGMASTGEVRLHSDIHMPIGGTDVLLLEDIVDTGLTANWLIRHLASHQPASVRLCTLLDKPEAREIPVHAHYVGFTIPKAFVIGYGLDYNEEYRNLPAVHIARPVGGE